MDIDLETLEALLKDQEQEKKNKLKKKNDKRRRNSESSYSRTQRSETPHQKSRKIEKFDPLKINFKENSEENKYDMNKKKSFQYKEKEEEEEKTIMITNVSKYATRQELFLFLKENNTGKVDKIRFVKDRETGKMTGRTFVQFYTSEDAKNALNLTNKKFMGHTLKIVIALPHKKRDHKKKLLKKI